MSGLTYHVRTLLVAASAALLLTGCASSRGTGGGTRDCSDAIDPRFLAAGPVFRGCQVDQQAQMLGRPQLSSAPTMDRLPSGCMSAEVEFVVDADGSPRTEHIRIVRATSTDLANRLREAVPSLRYSPARKGGEPVPQLVRFRVATMRVVTRAGSGLPTPPRVPTNC